MVLCPLPRSIAYVFRNSTSAVCYHKSVLILPHLLSLGRVQGYDYREFVENRVKRLGLSWANIFFKIHPQYSFPMSFLQLFHIWKTGKERGVLLNCLDGFDLQLLQCTQSWAAVTPPWTLVRQRHLAWVSVSSSVQRRLCVIRVYPSLSSMPLGAHGVMPGGKRQLL